MHTSSVTRNPAQFGQGKCLAIFVLMLIPFFAIVVVSGAAHTFIFHGTLFLCGWVSWTFLEYMIHRFWMHHKHSKDDQKNSSSHMHHHHHPTEIKISGLQRVLFLFSGAILLCVSYWFNNYFTLFTGLFFGFVLYCFMHVWLHQPWSQRIFKHLHRFHIYHHCRYPDKCFGISVTWWDKLFRTTPPAEAAISQRIIEFYFGHKH